MVMVNNISGTPSRTSLGISSASTDGYIDGSSSLIGYDKIIYTDLSTYEIKYCYDSDSAYTAPTDTDGDGVTDADDLCAGTTDMSTVDGDGCSDSQRDVDGDGSTADLDCDDADATDFREMRRHTMTVQIITVIQQMRRKLHQ